MLVYFDKNVCAYHRELRCGLKLMTNGIIAVYGQIVYFTSTTNFFRKRHDCFIQP